LQVQQNYSTSEYLELKANIEYDEFVSLRRAYKGEKNVSIQEMKKDMIKAIEVIQSKLEVNDRLTDVLSMSCQSHFES